MLLVRWEQHEASLLRRFRGYLADDAFVDVTLCCPGRSFRAHRVLLSACSEYLERVLLEQPASSSGEPVAVVLNGVEADDVAALLQLVYQGQAQVAPSDLPRFLDSARLLGVRLLRSAALRICAAGPSSGAGADHQIQAFEGKSQVQSHQTPANDTDRTAPPVSVSVGDTISQNRVASIEDRFSVSKEQSSLSESTGQETSSPKHHLSVAQSLTPLPPQDFAPQRTVQLDTAALQREQITRTWSTPAGVAAPLQQCAVAVPTPQWPDSHAAAAPASQPASAGHSTAGATTNQWQVPPLQEQRFDGNSWADLNQTSENGSNKGPPVVSALIKPLLPQKPQATMECKFTISQGQTSLTESAEQETYSPKKHLSGAQTLLSQGFAPPSVLRSNAAAAQVQVTSAWSAPTAVALPLQHSVKQVPPPLPAVPTSYWPGSQSPTAPANATHNTAGAPTYEWHVR